MVITLNKNIKNNGITLINYSNERYTKAQKINTKSAIKNGGFKKVISYSQSDIDVDFCDKNIKIFDYQRGGGYWLWKSYLIKKTLSEMGEGEYLFYCDSGSHFIQSIDELINSFDTTFDIMPFEIQTLEKHWTKRDCFQLMGCDEFKIIESKQILSGFSLWKKTKFAMKFVEEWLNYSKDERIVTDIDNVLRLPNYDGFVEHRHDQSIFSLLAKKYKLKVYCDPSQFGNNYKHLYPDSKYPQLLISTRQMNISFFEYIKKKLRPYMSAKFRHFYLSQIKTKLKIS
jgi:hypothetical protein